MSAMADDERWVICHPITSLPTPWADSVERWCLVCSQAVWVAASTLRMMERHPDTKVICNDCVEGVVAASGEPVQVLAVDEREVRATIQDEAEYQATLRYWRHKLKAKR